jgi:hypothetical protein
MFGMKPVDRDKCLQHADRKHCWHQNGLRGFSGKHKTTTPVKCCHRKKTAKLIEYAPQSSIEYDPELT